ncbi:MAG: ATP-binding protein [Clostridiales bacterium]|nr:ATP-binding protein [Clostridiales bacterium]
MGLYLNSRRIFSLYQSEAAMPYFIDKTPMLGELIPLVEQGNQNLCITRPRRFGKSVVAAMIGAFFSKGADSSSVFDTLAIAKNLKYKEHLNQHDVIYIDFSKSDDQCSNYKEYIDNIKEILREDFHEAYQNIHFREKGTVMEDMLRIYESTGKKFILIFDEWDYIFHRNFFTEKDRRSYTSFLAGLTKDSGCVSMTYMTGILPIAKYSQSATLNNFKEYTMSVQPKYSEYFGFTDKEVDELYERYCRNTKNPLISRQELEFWYDGYETAGKERMYNPRSVVYALTNNHLASYWTSSGQYAEISNYIVNNIKGVKDDVILMAAGEAVPANVEEYAATSMNLSTKDEIFSAMVVYGFLNYKNGYVRIPNRELMDEFGKTIRKESSYSYMQELEKKSDRILQATLDGNTAVIEEILEFVHHSESPLKGYDNEAELSGIVKLAYISARNQYDIIREDQAGTGYVDYIFYPYDRKSDGIILKLKVNDTPEHAIWQIKDKKYALKFKGKLGEKPKTTGRILAVGIGYQKKDKVHHCKIEVLGYVCDEI